MSNDPFASQADNAYAASRAPFAVVPSDASALTVIPKALYVGTGGTIVLRGVDAAADVTFKNVASGQVIDVRAHYVRATGTTAADIVAMA